MVYPGGETTLCTTDETLTPVTVVSPVEGIMATIDVVESWAKERDCSIVTVI